MTYVIHYTGHRKSHSLVYVRVYSELMWVLNSIEGSLIIIAACIPILQPILEMIKGRSIWQTKKSSSNRQYEDYSKQSEQKPGIELRSQQKKKVDMYGFTMHAKDNSEESIVHPDKQSATTSSSRHSETFHAHDGIVKTNAVTIAYDHGEEGPSSAATRWAAV